VIEAEAQAEVLTLALAGELDVGTQATTSALIEEALKAAPSVLVLDLREVDFLGSTGLSVLIEAQRAAEARNTVICLVANRRATLLPLELTGLTGRVRGARPPRITVDPETVFDPVVYARALKQMEDLYKSQGYLSVRAGPPRLEPIGGNPSRVEVTIPIKEGEQTRVARVLVEGGGDEGVRLAEAL